MIRLALIAGAVLAVLAGIGGIYAAGYNAGTKGEALRTERAVAAERTRVEGVKDAELAAQRRQFEITLAENAADQKQVDELEAEFAAREAELLRQLAEDAKGPTPAVGCRCSTNPPISSTDAERLNAIR